MLFIGGSDDGIGNHHGYVAGRYRNGALTSSWTDVTRSRAGTFTAYLPVCECGWHGDLYSPDHTGALRCRREWARTHLLHVLPTRHARTARR